MVEVRDNLVGQALQCVYAMKDAEDGKFKKDELLQFLGTCMVNARNTTSQCFQDIWVLDEYRKLRSKSDMPFFVEFGGDDGKLDSNTYLLQWDGWAGILAEPNPVPYKKLQENRRARHVQTYNLAVWNQTGLSLPFMSSDVPNLSTLKQFADSDYNAESRKDNYEIIHVDTITLYDLLERDHAPRVIDYISVDTEGSEYDILSKFFTDNKRLDYYVEMFTVEHNFNKDAIEKIWKLMDENGYEQRFPEVSRWDSFWRRKRG